MSSRFCISRPVFLNLVVIDLIQSVPQILIELLGFYRIIELSKLILTFFINQNNIILIKNN
jgi:hypothetical protein